MLLLCAAIVFRSPLLKQLDQIFRQITYYKLCHRSLLRLRIRQLFRLYSADASIDSTGMHGLLLAARSGAAHQARANGVVATSG
jgi:hypothetical protein